MDGGLWLWWVCCGSVRRGWVCVHILSPIEVPSGLMHSSLAAVGLTRRWWVCVGFVMGLHRRVKLAAVWVR